MSAIRPRENGAPRGAVCGAVLVALFLASCASQPRPRFLPDESGSANPADLALPDSELASGESDAAASEPVTDPMADAAPKLASLRARLSTGCAVDADCKRIPVKVGGCGSDFLVYGKDATGVDDVRKDLAALEMEFAAKGAGPTCRVPPLEPALECVRGSCETVQDGK